MKKTIFAIILCGATVLSLTGCGTIKEKNKEKDYSNHSFTDVSWTRDAENDVETIVFKSNGRFTYYCSCGNPVNDSDLCEGYIYDDATKTITLDFIETTDEMVTTIKIVKCDGNSLQLDFNGEIRIFEKLSVNLVFCKRFVRGLVVKCEFEMDLYLKGGSAYDG